MMKKVLGKIFFFFFFFFCFVVTFRIIYIIYIFFIIFCIRFINKISLDINEQYIYIYLKNSTTKEYGNLITGILFVTGIGK